MLLGQVPLHTYSAADLSKCSDCLLRFSVFGVLPSLFLSTQFVFKESDVLTAVWVLFTQWLCFSVLFSLQTSHWVQGSIPQTWSLWQLPSCSLVLFHQEAQNVCSPFLKHIGKARQKDNMLFFPLTIFNILIYGHLLKVTSTL